ncbi:MAG: MBG domain-containing protein, partial [Bacteroidota bacterium]
EDESVLNSLPTASATANSSSGVGTYPVTLSAGSDDNYAFSLVEGSLEILPATLVATAQDISRIYGETNPAFAVAYSGFVTGEDESVLTTEATATTAADSSSAVGSYAITASSANADNYTVSYVEGTLTVEQASLTITANDQSKVYGEANPATSLSYSGFVNGDDANELDALPSASYGAVTRSTGVGNYPITLSGGSDANYAYTLVEGTLTVTPATLTVTADDQSRTYGSTDPTFTLSYSGFENAESETDLAELPVASTTANATSGVGEYPITVSGGLADNYSFVYTPGTLTIIKALLEATADSFTLTYGDSLPELTIRYEGFANGQDASALIEAPSVSSAVTENSGVGTYAITLSGGADANYSLQLNAGTVTINPAALTVSADDQTKTYGQANPILNLTYTGFVKEEDAGVLTTAPTVRTDADAGSDVGTYTITVLGGEADNYVLTTESGILTIGKAELIAQPDTVFMTEGEAVPTLTIGYTGFVNGDTEADLDIVPAISTTATSSSALGEYPITLSGGQDNNYTLVLAEGLLIIQEITGLGDRQLEGVKLYPMPFMNTFTVRLPEDAVGTYSITLHDFNGRVMHQTQVDSFYQEVEISALTDAPSGMYWITITSEENEYGNTRVGSFRIMKK